MSHRVQLVLHPDGDDTFASHATVAMELGLPRGHSVAEVIAVTQQRLRKRYPRAAIHVEPIGDDGDSSATWHVYRDGLPARGHRGSAMELGGLARPEGFEPPTY